MKCLMSKRAVGVGLPLALVFSFFLVMGRAYDKVQQHPMTTGQHYLLILILGILIYPLIIGLWECISRRNEASKSIKEDASDAFTRKHRVMIFGMLFIAWIPCWLAAYPGFFCYDATQEFNGVYNNMFSAHHPIWHSMLLTYPMMLSERVFGNFNVGIAAYCLFQMICGAAVFSYVVCFLQKYVRRIWVSLLALTYYMFCPVIVLFSSCTTKDVMSGLLVTFFLLRFYELHLCEGNEGGKKGTWRVLLSVGLVAIVLFSKKNIVIAMVLYLFFQVCYRKQWKKRATVLLCGMAVYYLGNGVMMKVLEAEPSAIAEALSVPAQQIAAVYTYEGGREAFNEEQWEMLCNIFVEEELEGNYCPWLSDPVKQRIESQYVSGHLMEFVQLWGELLLTFPEHYLNAFNYMTYQAWYPFTDMTGYNNTWYTYQEFKTCFFACTIEAPGTLESVFPGLFEKMRSFSLQECVWKKPVIGMLCSVGFHMWMLLFAIGYSVYKKQWKRTVLLLFPCCLILTNFMGPIVLVRYYLFLFYLFPIVLGTMCMKRE